MTEQRLNRIYDLLVSIGGAVESYRQQFILLHMETPSCREWRFMGHLGFGGKYRSQTNKVDCYSEDETPERLAIIKQLNSALGS
jgi:hypothetical protein